MMRCSRFNCGFALCALSLFLADAAATSAAEPARWVAITPTSVPDRENYSGSQFYSPPEGCGAIDPRAVATVLVSHTRRRPIAQALIDCVDGDAENGMVMKLDFTCGNNFHDDNAVTVPLRHAPGGMYGTGCLRYSREPISFVLDGETRMAYLAGAYNKRGNSRYLWINFGMALKGVVELDGRDCDIYFCEADGDGKVTGPTSAGSLDSASNLGDIVLIPDPKSPEDYGHPLAFGLYDHPTVVGDAVYRFTLDENRIPVAEKLDMPMTKMHLDQPRWRLEISDGRKLLFLCGDREPVSVPVGRYKLLLADICYILDSDRDHRVSMLARDYGQTTLDMVAGQVNDESLDAILRPVLGCGEIERGRITFTCGSGAYRSFYYKQSDTTSDADRGAVLELSTTDGKVFRKEVMGGTSRQYTCTVALDRPMPRQFRAQVTWPSQPMMKDSNIVEIDLDATAGAGGF